MCSSRKWYAKGQVSLYFILLASLKSLSISCSSGRHGQCSQEPDGFWLRFSGDTKGLRFISSCGAVNAPLSETYAARAGGGDAALTLENLPHCSSHRACQPLSSTDICHHHTTLRASRAGVILIPERKGGGKGLG